MTPVSGDVSSVIYSVDGYRFVAAGSEQRSVGLKGIIGRRFALQDAQMYWNLILLTTGNVQLRSVYKNRNERLV